MKIDTRYMKLKNNNIFYENYRDIEKLINRVNKLFDSWNYKGIITPSLEFYDEFTNNGNEIDNGEDIYQFFNSRGEILTLKSDCTTSIARLINSDIKYIKDPLKFRYLSNVFKVNKIFSEKGHDEYIDYGVEYIGGEAFYSDIEILILGIEAIKRSNLNDFKIEIGHIGILKRICDLSGLNNYNMEYLTKLIEDKKLIELSEYLDELNINNEYKEIFKKVPWYFGGKEILEDIKKSINDNVINDYIEYLNKIYNSLLSMGYERYLSFNLGIIPRVKYYSGIVFRGCVDGFSNYILHGGRYDKLIKINNNSLKAVGLSLRINDLASIMDNKTFLEEDSIEKIFYNEKNFENKVILAKEKAEMGKKIILLMETK